MRVSEGPGPHVSLSIICYGLGGSVRREMPPVYFSCFWNSFPFQLLDRNLLESVAWELCISSLTLEGLPPFILIFHNGLTLLSLGAPSHLPQLVPVVVELK